jgi:hypothetical protein
MEDLQRELEEVEKRRQEILYELYIITKYDLTNNGMSDTK